MNEAEQTLEEMFGLATAESAPLAVAPKQDVAEALRTIEQRMFHKAMVVAESIMAAADIDVQNLEDSKRRFIDEYGQEDGEKRFRVALAAWQNSKDAPAFLKLSTSVATAGAKARAAAPPAVAQVNISFVQMNGPTQILESVVVDE
jgi:hypothetical protein